MNADAEKAALEFARDYFAQMDVRAHATELNAMAAAFCAGANWQKRQVLTAQAVIEKAFSESSDT